MRPLLSPELRKTNGTLDDDRRGLARRNKIEAPRLQLYKGLPVERPGTSSRATAPEDTGGEGASESMGKIEITSEIT
jgi:hypothetical protein